MERLDYRKFGTEGFQLLGQISQLGKKSSLGHVLIELVKLRASQINHCAHCVNMHANALRKEGESEERIQSIVVWEEANCFTARERAAFAWTESVTLVADTGVPDEVDEEQFDDSYVALGRTYGSLTTDLGTIVSGIAEGDWGHEGSLTAHDIETKFGLFARRVKLDRAIGHVVVKQTSRP